MQNFKSKVKSFFALFFNSVRQLADRIFILVLSQILNQVQDDNLTI